MEFHRRPSITACILRGLHRTPGLREAGGFPPLRARWIRHRIDRRHLAEFLRVTGLASDRGVPLLYPHVFGFPLQMAILTHPAFPIPLWRALQIRNHLLRRRPIGGDAVLDLETAVAGQRILDKGAEVDLHTTVRAGEELLWESLTTIYYRGRFGEAGVASPLSRAPEVGGELLARWRTSSGAGWRFGRLTGDYNGVHWSRRYARMFGFRRDFQHPQLVLGQCMARLRAFDPARGERLDAWLKGPVYYDSDASLRATMEPDGVAFALNVQGEDRPAIVGRYRAVTAGGGLLA
jgi:hypothetical protein